MMKDTRKVKHGFGVACDVKYQFSPILPWNKSLKKLEENKENEGI